MNARTLLLLAPLAAVFACNPYDPNLGDTPFRCGTSDPVCPDGYACVENSPADRVCVRESSPEAPDGGSGGTDASLIDCTGDNNQEPNESVADPTVTPIPDFQDSLQLVGMQICPEGDVNVYYFRIDTQGKNVKVNVMYSSGGGTLLVNVLNQDGTSIKTGTSAGNPDLIAAEVPNLPIGKYYAQVRGDQGVRNSYDITISVTGP